MILLDIRSDDVSHGQLYIRHPRTAQQQLYGQRAPCIAHSLVIERTPLVIKAKITGICIGHSSIEAYEIFAYSGVSHNQIFVCRPERTVEHYVMEAYSDRSHIFLTAVG